MPEGTSYSAFISYASPDKERAFEICQSLEERGLRCWIAPRDLRAGHEYANEILHGIHQSRSLVLVLSDAANNSIFVRREVERAVSKGKPVFPVRIEEVLPSAGLELFVSTTHWLDAWTGRLADHIDKLARDLTDDSVIAEGAAQSQKVARRRRLPKWIGIAAAFAALVSAIVLGNYLSGRFRPDATAGNGSAQHPTTAMAVTEEWARMQAERAMAHAGITPVDLSKVKPEEIKASDFELVPTTSYRSLTVEVRATKPAVQRTVQSAELQYRLTSEGPFQRAVGGRIRFSQRAGTDDSKHIEIRYKFRDGTTVGPFGYPFDATAAIAAAEKTEILGLPEWIHSHQHTISFGPLYTKTTALKAMHIGEAADTLDRTLIFSEVPGAGHVSTSAVTANAGVKVRPGLKTLYVQLEFRDGTRSEVRKHTLADNDRLSVELPEIDGEKAAPAPRLFATYSPHGTSGRIEEYLELLPYAPLGTTRILMALDGEKLETVWQSRSDEMIRRQWHSAPWKPTRTIRLLYQLGDEKEVGPFTYSADKLFDVLVLNLKGTMIRERRDAIRFVRITEGEIGPADGSTRGGRDIKLYYHLGFPREVAGLGDDRDPALYMVASRHHICGLQGTWAWSIVKEIHAGTEAGKLDRKIPVNLLVEKMLPYRQDDWKHFADWYAKFPVDTKTVYVKYVFRDGSTGPETRFDVGEAQ